MMEVETPDKVAQNNQIEEIREQVDYLHSLRQKSTEDGLRNVGDEYKTTRIVAWLLNRSVESQKAERDQFFRRVNETLQGQFTDENGMKREINVNDTHNISHSYDAVSVTQ